MTHPAPGGWVARPRLKDEEVRKIRAALATDMVQKDIAAMFGVPVATVSGIQSKTRYGRVK